LERRNDVGCGAHGEEEEGTWAKVNVHGFGPGEQQYSGR
jgi:hypothetical protein